MEIAAAPAVETVVVCSKCKLNPRADVDGTNPWCNECRAKYAKEYKEMFVKRTTDQAFARGVEAMRQMLAGEFQRLGIGQFTGFDVAHLIRGAIAPKQSEPISDR